ncbi:right-handed parallel beta-helix repeat-containing protein [Pedobacter sp. P351]|uniref:right-handed parallel beta-helix repeat-containing protein n=1 Tax=Pedobacter superstes TaxID=3133441 RepID=UPI0030AAEF54
MKRKILSVAMLSVALISSMMIVSCKKDDSVFTQEVTGSSKTAAKVSAVSGEVVSSGSSWISSVNGVQVYSGTDYGDAINAAINNLTPGRTTKEWVYVRNSGNAGPSGDAVRGVVLQSNTGLDFTGTTFNATDQDLLTVPVRADNKSNIEVKNLHVIGYPRYGIWFRGCSNIILTNITMDLQSPGLGIGIRVDNTTGKSSNLAINGTLDFVGGEHGIETLGVTGITISDISVSRNRGCGVLLNKSSKATIGTVTGNYNNNGGGYATFRVANDNGPEITVTKVYSRNSGRGFFSVSGSGGTTIGTVDIASSTDGNILLQDADNTYINGGTSVASNNVRNIQHYNTRRCVTKVNGQTYTGDGIW